MEEIKKVANEIAISICELTIINESTLTDFIYLKFKTSMSDILKAKLTVEEREYLKLIELQSTNRVGSKEYTEIGYKLSALKTKKSTANRLLNEIKKESKLSKLKEFFEKNYTVELFYELCDSAIEN